MRTLELNKLPFHYALFKSKTPIVDEYDNLTGEYEITYYTPVAARANISPAVGRIVTELFGDREQYEKLIITYDVNCPIAESTILWIDVPTTEAHDYIVKRVSRSLNHVVYAVSKVTVGA